MDPRLKYGLCWSTIIVINYCCNMNFYSKANCDKTEFHDSNKLNDTGKLVFENRVVFDTTANRLSGQIIDSITGSPISKAWVLITKGSQKFLDSTNDRGEF